MLQMTAMVERPQRGVSRPWPISLAPSPLRLDRTCSDGDLGAFVAALHGGDPTLEDPELALRRLLTQRPLSVCGGLMVTDGDVTIWPGCCHDLDTWPQWWGLVDDPAVTDLWLGHSPDPFLVQTDTGWLLVQDEGEPHGPAVEISRTELPDALQTVAHDLSEVAVLIERWAAQLAGARVATALAVAVEEDLAAPGRR